MNCRTLISALVFAAPVFAQLAAPNPAGVSMGHLHIRTPDVAAHRKLWIDALGGAPGKFASMETAKFPGVVVLYEKGGPSTGTVGSVVNHVGFHVRDLKATLAKVRASGIRVETESATGAFIIGPDEVRIELLENTALATPVAFHHVHFFDTATLATQAWYVKLFDAKPGRRANFDAADLPGVNLTFTGIAHGRHRRHQGPDARSHRLRSSRARSIRQETGSAGREVRPDLHEHSRSRRCNRVPHRPVRNVRGADGRAEQTVVRQKSAGFA